jgi:hypothetical protein
VAGSDEQPDLPAELPIVREAFERTVRLVPSARLREAVMTLLADDADDLALLAEIESATSGSPGNRGSARRSPPACSARCASGSSPQPGEALASRYGGIHDGASAGDHVAGVYRERVTLASGRFAMIDNGLGFQLVPWRQDLERQLGQPVTGTVNERGGVDWSLHAPVDPAI